MFPTTINGVPTHPLLVHIVVVLVPLTALLVVLAAVWPAAARRLSWVPAVLAVVTVGAIPVTTQAGEWLERRVAPTPLVGAHTAIADDLLPWQIAVAVLAIALEWLRRRATRTVADGVSSEDTAQGTTSSKATAAGGAGGVTVAERTADRTAPPAWARPVTVVVAALAVVASVGAVVEVYRIGESGAQAVWQGRYNPQAPARPHHGG